MSIDDPPIDITAPALGGLLRLVHETHVRRVYVEVTTDDFEDITPAQFQLFRWPGPGGLRPSEVAERTGLSKQAVNDLIGALERNGYLTRRPDPLDARARIVELTDQGDRLLYAAYRTSTEVEARWAQLIGDERLSDLRATLAEMVEHGLPESVD